jgi:uncharacterized membrane protein
MKRFIRYFAQGALVSAPLVATVYVIYLVVSTFDKLFSVPIPGLGLVLAVVLVTLVGFLTSNVVGKTLFKSAEELLQRTPLIKLLYTSIKDLISAFVGQNKRFDQPVAVRLSADSPVAVLGFVTRKSLPELGLADRIAVYVPQSYNFAGNLLIVPATFVQPLHVPSGDVMTFVVSGGVSGFGQGETMPPSSPVSTGSIQRT